jgi:predicted dehydrogenase
LTLFTLPPTKNAPRIAVLGCGSIGRRHLQNSATLGDTDLVGFDPNPQVAETVSNETGVSVTTSIDEVWERRPETVIIAGPTNHHIELALAAAKIGCHLFIEKPLSHSLIGVDQLQAEVHRSSLVSLIGCNMRFHPGPIQIREWLDREIIGQPLSARIQTGSYLPRWRPQQDYRDSYSASPEWGGAVLDCIHEIDLALWFMGPGEVAAALTRPANVLGLETDGLSEIILEHADGALSNVHLNFVQRNYHRSIQIIGSEGTIEWDFNEGKTKRFGPDGELAECAVQPQGWELNQMYLDELHHFLDCVDRGVPTCNPVEQGAEALKVALQARKQD